MKRPIRALVAVAVVVAGGALFAARTVESHAEVAPAAPAVGSPPARTGTVTLLTGDRVSLGSDDGEGLSIRPGEGRSGMRFVVERTADGTYVIPVDALARIRNGTLDRRQFNVTDKLTPSRKKPDAPQPTDAGSDAETYALTVTYLDRDGAPAPNAFARVVGLEHNAEDWPVPDGNGVSVSRLPTGRYNLGVYIDDEEATTLLTHPVTLDRDLAITVDARAAKPVSMTVPEPSAALGFVDVGYSVYPSYLTYPLGMFLSSDRFDRVRVGHLGDRQAPDQMVGTVAAQWGRPDGTGDFTDSPYLYTVAEAFPGRLPTGFAKTYRTGDFAAVHQRFAADSLKQEAKRVVYPSYTPRQGSFTGLLVPTTLGGTRVEYHNTAMPWHSEMHLGIRDDDGTFVPRGKLYRQPTAYRAGQRHHDEWNAGPAGPVLGQTPLVAWQWASRSGDRIDVDLPLYGDRAGHAGWRTPDGPSRTALYRDGVPVDEFPVPGGGSFAVPPDDAGYRLEVADPRVTAVWTFRSAHVDGDRPAKLPLSVVRFVPELDAGNTAPAGRPFVVPVVVEGQPDAPATKTRLRSAEVSYDGGATWTAAPFTPSRDGWSVALRHPDGARSVSLRASAVDTAGNTVVQTVVDAYGLR